MGLQLIKYGIKTTKKWLFDWRSRHLQSFKHLEMYEDIYITEELQLLDYFV